MGVEWYEAQGIEVVDTDRGGRVTYHGPGQLVGYPIVSLRPYGDDVIGFVRGLERVAISALASHGVEAGTIEGQTGVWTRASRRRVAAARKIGSIGIHVSRGVTTHGLAINVNNDLQPFEWVVPCGIEGCRVTSLGRELGAEQEIGSFAATIASRYGEEFGREPVRRARPAGGGARYARSMSAERAAPPDPAPGAPDEARGPRCTRSRANPGGTAAETAGALPFRRARKPRWLKVPAPGGPNYRRLKATIGSDNLHTVCEEANCPNVGECWERGTATFMILGDTCTRRCGFCNVKTGVPTWNDPLEPLRVANQVKRMGLRHAVVTSVDRDDLPDYGASAFVGVIRSIRMQAPGCRVEVLTPDFRGQEMPLARVIAERPDVFNHNVETVPRLYPRARRGSKFLRSARVLRMAKEMGGDDVVTKSGLMVGLGESFEEMVEAFGILREHRVQVLTVGQYLRPTENHLPVVRYWHPEEFEALERAAYGLGFESVASGPLVRSSYHADQNLPRPAAAAS